MLKMLRAVAPLIALLLSAALAHAQPFGATAGNVPVGPVKYRDSVASAANLRTFDAGGYTQVTWQFTSVGSGNSVTSEISYDGGTTYIAWQSFKPTSLSAGTSTGWTISTTDVYQTTIPAGTRFRLRVSTYGSGTVTSYTAFSPATESLFTMTGPGSSSSQTTVVGNVASLAADSGNPVKTGCKYNASGVSATDGNRVDTQCNIAGAAFVAGYLNTGVDGVGNTQISSIGVSNSTGLRPLATAPWLSNGTTYDREFTCANSAVVNVAAAATTQLVALSGSTVIRVCSFVISGDTLATTAKFVYGTGANCGSGTTDITGAMRLPDEGSIAISAGNGSVFRGLAANALCLTAVTGAVTGFVTYAQY